MSDSALRTPSPPLAVLTLTLTQAGANSGPAYSAQSKRPPTPSVHLRRRKDLFYPPPPLFFGFLCRCSFFGLTLCSCCTVSLSCQLRFEASFALLYEWRRAGLLGHGGDVRPPATRDCTRHCIESWRRPSHPIQRPRCSPGQTPVGPKVTAPPSAACVSAQRYASPN